MNQCLKQSMRSGILTVVGASLLTSQVAMPAAAQQRIQQSIDQTDTQADTVSSAGALAATSVTADTAPATIGEESEPRSKNSVLVETRLVLSLRDREVSLYRGDRLVNSYPVAVGASDTPTPQGQFTVSHMVVDPVWQSPWTGEIHDPGPNSALGLRWIGFTANDEGSFGFHGTPTVDSIGKAVSNGCVRMYNEDVVKLFEQVRVGTSVVVTD